jgi:hypothetical protein
MTYKLYFCTLCKLTIIRGFPTPAEAPAPIEITLPSVSTINTILDFFAGNENLVPTNNNSAFTERLTTNVADIRAKIPFDSPVLNQGPSTEDLKIVVVDFKGLVAPVIPVADPPKPLRKRELDAGDIVTIICQRILSCRVHLPPISPGVFKRSDQPSVDSGVLKPGEVVAWASEHPEWVASTLRGWGDGSLAIEFQPGTPTLTAAEVQVLLTSVDGLVSQWKALIEGAEPTKTVAARSVSSSGGLVVRDIDIKLEVNISDSAIRALGDAFAKLETAYFAYIF